MRPLLPQLFAGGAYLVGGAHQVLEGAFEVLAQIQPVTAVNIQAGEDGGQIFRDGAALVVSDYAACPVHQFDVDGVVSIFLVSKYRAKMTWKYGRHF